MSVLDTTDVLDVAGYAAAVRRSLADLGPELVDDLTDDLDADLAEALAGEAEPGYQPVQGSGQHVLVGAVGVGTAGACEGNAVSANDYGVADGGSGAGGRFGRGLCSHSSVSLEYQNVTGITVTHRT